MMSDLIVNKMEIRQLLGMRISEDVYVQSIIIKQDVHAKQYQIHQIVMRIELRIAQIHGIPNMYGIKQKWTVKS